LGAEGAFVQGVADQAQEEDGQGEGVAGVQPVAPREFGEGVGAVFGAGGRVPEGGVEDDGGGGDCVGAWGLELGVLVGREVVLGMTGWEMG